ncbi:hypothetical protein B0T10DRAFT_581967 [Thelonectria olida]|uniref:Zn(2)-C6 fungal-type domain-containing protein n=1 Tax=Thelonectria olida TaxID=1576542 RepID=A0A9P8VXL0_9HYPO|nr:hypothetical protein B0T10DRAFT_581967 [Thelonectria olida]
MDNPTPKRFACDRCREQKLRCPRNQNKDGSCDRCVRLGALCLTSKGRPLGRPRLNSNDQSSRKSSGARPSHGEQRRRYSTIRHPSVSTSNPPPSPSTFPSSSASTSEIATNIFPIDSNCDSIFTTQLNDFLTSNAAATGLDFPSPQPWVCPDLVPDVDYGGVQGDVPKSVDQGPPRENDNTKNIGSETDEPWTRHSVVDRDPMPTLVGVMRGIARQLSELKTKTWNPNSMLAMLFDGRDIEFGSTTRPNPLEDSMCLSMKFVLVLQMIASVNSAERRPDYLPTLSLKLMLITTYLQLGQLFEAILNRISTSLVEIPELISPSTTNSTDNQRRFAVQPDGLHVMMMVQCFEDQLSSAESLMGFPTRFRLWSQHQASNTVLGDDTSFPLAETVMGQVQGTFQSLKRTIESLRSCLS